MVIGRYGGGSNDDGSFGYGFEIFENNVNFVDGKFPGAIVNFELVLRVFFDPSLPEPEEFIAIGDGPFFGATVISDRPISLDLIPNFVPPTDEDPARIEYTFTDIDGQSILQEAFDSSNISIRKLSYFLNTQNRALGV